MDYESLVKSWAWQIPERYNIALDCADKNALGERRNKIALYWENDAGDQRKLTFLDVTLLSNRFANGLSALGISHRDRMIIRLGNVPEFPIVFLGGIKAGALPVPTSIKHSSRELEARVKGIAAAGIVTAPEYVGEVEAIWDRCPSLRTLIVVGEEDRASRLPSGLRVGYRAIMENASASRAPVETAADDEAFLCYSSCTTGEPKAMVHAHRWVIGNDPSALYWQAYRPDDVVACTGPLSWIFPLGNAFLYAWRHGVSVLLYDGEFDPERWFKLLEDYRVTNLASTPTAYRSLLAINQAERRYELASLRHCTSCGEHLNSAVVEEWRGRFGLDILDGLGMSECMTYVSNLAGMRVKPGSCGRPQPGHNCILLDPQTREPAGQNRPGVMAIREDDPGLLARYWGRPERSQQRGGENWFLTGDILRRDDEGYYWCLGRADDLIGRAGSWVSPFEVESAVAAHEGVLEAAAVPAHDHVLGTVIKCFVTVQPGYDATPRLAQGIIEFAGRRLEKHQRPQEIEFVTRLPKTHSGKIKRKMLRELERSRRHSPVATVHDTYPEFLVSLTDIGAE